MEDFGNCSAEPDGGLIVSKVVLLLSLCCLDL